MFRRVKGWVSMIADFAGPVPVRSRPGCQPLFNPIVPQIDCVGEWQSACSSAHWFVRMVFVTNLFVGSAPLEALAIYP
ncbi:Uncharacterised protein [Mycobacteroides abscessus subsp. abscessus]|nr:Uncharacterised protein [Mycobacteroides abscessus subsp. abscessus]